MTLEKLLRIVKYLYGDATELSMHGSHLYVNGGGELVLSLNTQPSQETDSYLRLVGFICHEGEYIYRPIKRKRKVS